MKLLVFAGTRDAIHRYAMSDDWEIILPQYPSAQRQEILKKWVENPQGKLAVLGKSILTGWRAPADTQVLFDPSWSWGPGSPEWTQATM